jgi:hypothetical protein
VRTFALERSPDVYEPATEQGRERLMNITNAK